MAKAAAPVEELVSKIKHGELQERNGAGSEKSGELLFWEAGDALDSQGQLQDHGAISGRRKLPWPYHRPDAVHDDLPARLLALNAERYAQEMALGLHSNAGMQAAKAVVVGSGGGERTRAVRSEELKPSKLNRLG
jgi:hypothetical protein